MESIAVSPAASKPAVPPTLSSSSLRNTYNPRTSIKPAFKKKKSLPDLVLEDQHQDEEKQPEVQLDAKPISLLEILDQQKEKKTQSAMNCQIHNQQANIFCTECSLQICQECRDSPIHEGHNFLNETVTFNRRAEASFLRMKFENVKATFNAKIQKLKADRTDEIKKHFDLFFESTSRIKEQKISEQIECISKALVHPFEVWKVETEGLIQAAISKIAYSVIEISRLQERIELESAKFSDFDPGTVVFDPSVTDKILDFCKITPPKDFMNDNLFLESVHDPFAGYQSLQTRLNNILKNDGFAHKPPQLTTSVKNIKTANKKRAVSRPVKRDFELAAVKFTTLNNNLLKEQNKISIVSYLEEQANGNVAKELTLSNPLPKKKQRAVFDPFKHTGISKMPGSSVLPTRTKGERGNTMERNTVGGPISSSGGSKPKQFNIFDHVYREITLPGGKRDSAPAIKNIYHQPVNGSNAKQQLQYLPKGQPLTAKSSLSKTFQFPKLQSEIEKPIIRISTLDKDPLKGSQTERLDPNSHVLPSSYVQPVDKLDMRGNGCEDEIMAAISGISRLNQVSLIDLAQNELDDRQLKKLLLKMVDLKIDSLGLEGNQLTSAALEYLISFKNHNKELRAVFLKGNSKINIGDVATQKRIAALSQSDVTVHF